MRPCFDRLCFAHVGTEKHEGLPSPGVAVWKRPRNEGILICKSILVPFPVCGIEVNSAEERNGVGGKVLFLLGYRHGCAEEESVGCFFGWFLTHGSRSAGVVRGRRAQGSRCGRLALPAPLGSFPRGVNGLRLDSTYLVLFAMTKGESRSEGLAGRRCVMGEDCGCCGCCA